MSTSKSQNISNNILLNQIGYPTSAAKKALIRTEADNFILKDLNGKTVYSGNLSEPKYWELSGDAVSVADFSKITEEGKYILCINDTECTAPFDIGESL